MKYVLFDLDGTLVNSFDGIANCFLYAFEKLGVAPPTREKLKSCVGPPLLDSFLRYLGDEKRANDGVKFYRERYATLGYKECTLYDGVEECLSSLIGAGKILALSTSKPQVFAERILREKGVDKYFTVAVGSSLDNTFDKKGDIIRETLQRLGAKPCECVMVGDRDYDVLGAKENGVWCIGIDTGFAAAGELERAGADYIVYNHEKLSKILLER